MARVKTEAQKLAASEAQKLAALLLHLELNPDELERYQDSKEIARAELQHFGLTDKTIAVVLDGSMEAFGQLFEPLRNHIGFGAAEVKSSAPKK
jgi:hypothetical protein